MTAEGRRRRFGPLLAGAVLVADRDYHDPPPGGVRNVVAAYLADEGAAREEYRDAVVTASGVVEWSARREDVTTRLVPPNGVEPPAPPGDVLDEVWVRITVLDRHPVLAQFVGEDRHAALALRSAEPHEPE